ncbi:hypothetical protein DFJ58DRAFT_269293 [Suillus subalutaceus]|uniref:uncharacterized protein n=1 Tax=Suillus subalutaceus TaxID=48586 RepID=UPI001B8618D2|nr:uncharacterized protein DFJ58DRAFT_269293 [Suillus subalutaceus]KAG1860646.1 hypothetical protein DFJ58DRAFT_269293 [Suillus subalutaceus]
MKTCASTPFDHAKADIILRSADGVEFRVFTLFLSLTSPLFETLLCLPRTAGGATGTDQEMKDGLAVIAVSEDGKTLDSFLRFCYPSTLAEDPSLENLTDALPVLAAARKYSLDLIERKVCQTLVNPKVLETEPLRCFAISRNARLKHETIIAARHTLRHPLIPARCAEIDLITAPDLLALLTYHKKCSIAVQFISRDLSWMAHHYRNHNGCKWLFCPENCRCGRGDDRRFFLWGEGTITWWMTYMQEVSELLNDCPSGDTVRGAADRTVEKVRAANCTACSGQVKENMAEFSSLFAQKVEETVKYIYLEMDF